MKTEQPIVTNRQLVQCYEKHHEDGTGLLFLLIFASYLMILQLPEQSWRPSYNKR